MKRRGFVKGTIGLAGAAALGATAISDLLLARAVFAKHGDGGGGDDHGGSSGPPFDFSDAFLRQNGVDPTQLQNRVNGTGGGSVVATTSDPTRRNVRVLATFGGFDNDGSI